MSIFLPILATSTNVNIIVPLKLSLWVRIHHRSVVDLCIEWPPIGLTVSLPHGHIYSKVDARQDPPELPPLVNVADGNWVVVIYPLQGKALVLD